MDNRPDFAPSWPVCIEEGCRGAQHADTCLCHVHDYSGLKAGADLDLRGVEIDSALLAEVLGKSFRTESTAARAAGPGRHRGAGAGEALTLTKG